MAWIGGITAILTAFIAVAQDDLKRVLAYSTVSQLGFMFLALGTLGAVSPVFAVTAAAFHLFTHAFFKALLFLAAGIVMHAMGDVVEDETSQWTDDDRKAVATYLLGGG